MYYGDGRNGSSSSYSNMKTDSPVIGGSSAASSSHNNAGGKISNHHINNIENSKNNKASSMALRASPKSSSSSSLSSFSSGGRRNNGTLRLEDVVNLFERFGYQSFRVRNVYYQHKHQNARQTLEYVIQGRHLGFCCDRW